jgi:5-methylcytosine-specific restriction endonuclease McrA
MQSSKQSNNYRQFNKQSVNQDKVNHQDQHQGNSNSNNTQSNPTKRLYDSRQWRKAAKLFLSTHRYCRRCQSFGILKAASIVDHIKPHNGDVKLFWMQSNWQPLCPSCHSGWKRKRERGNIASECDIDGFPTDDLHSWNKGKE